MAKRQYQPKTTEQKAQLRSSTSSDLPAIPSRDLFHRVNFSYQASIFLQSLGESSRSHRSGGQTSYIGAPGSSASVDVKPEDRKGKGKAAVCEGKEDLADSHGRPVEFGRLARMGMKECRKMGVHTQLKLDPSLKRSICKECSIVLVPGLTSRLRNRPSRNTFNVTHQTCLNCHTQQSLPAPPISHTLKAGQSAIDLGNGLDGSVRASRRRKAAKRGKVQFHELEKGGRDAQGHELWRGEAKMDGWGVRLDGDGPELGSSEGS